MSSTPPPTDPDGHTDPLGQTMTYVYDGNGRIMSATDPLGPVTWTTYDAFGNVIGRCEGPAPGSNASPPPDGPPPDEPHIVG